MSEHRRRLRARGYRPVQLWVPDVRTSEFANEARRQAELVAASGRITDEQDFVEAISIAVVVTAARVLRGGPNVVHVVPLTRTLRPAASR